MVWEHYFRSSMLIFQIYNPKLTHRHLHLQIQKMKIMMNSWLIEIIKNERINIKNNIENHKKINQEWSKKLIIQRNKVLIKMFHHGLKHIAVLDYLITKKPRKVNKINQLRRKNIMLIVQVIFKVIFILKSSQYCQSISNQKVLQINISWIPNIIFHHHHCHRSIKNKFLFLKLIII